MKAFRKVFLFLLLLFFRFNFLVAQEAEKAGADHGGSAWFVNAGIGVQMSGIKDEDFVSHNIAPLINITAGKWFSQELALQAGYKGPYYNAIADDKKHHYYFLYGEALMNINSLFPDYDPAAFWHLLLHAGAGYYYSQDYKRPNICANLGLSNYLLLTNRLKGFMDFSAIVGWDIYQGDEDILPGVTMGISYSF